MGKARRSGKMAADGRPTDTLLGQDRSLPHKDLQCLASFYFVLSRFAVIKNLSSIGSFENDLALLLKSLETHRLLTSIILVKCQKLYKKNTHRIYHNI